MANIAVQERKTPVISMVPISVREQVEQIAQRERVSVSEVGRRAIQEYLQKQSR